MGRERCTRSFVLLLLLLLLLAGLPGSAPAVDGKFKYLIFPQGSNVQLIYCLTIGTLAKPEGFFTVGVTAGLAYELPYRRTVPYRKPAEVYHRRSRRDLYRKIEAMLDAQGRDGRRCVLRALCRAGGRNRQTGPGKAPFLHEILHAIFTFPAHPASADVEAEYDGAYAAQGDCDSLFPGSCPHLF